MEITRRTSVRFGPPTQGSIWAIVIIIAAHLNLALVECSLRTTEVFYLRWREEFETSAKQTAAVQSIAWSLSCSCGLIGGLMVKRFGCRMTGIVGGLLAVLGVFGSAWVRSIYQLYITAALNGVGLGILVNVSVVAVAQNIKQRYRTANALMYSGRGTGKMAAPPLVQFLLTSYGWRGAILVIAAITANAVVFASLFRPSRTLRKTELGNTSQNELDREKRESSSVQEVHPGQENDAEADRETETHVGTRDVEMIDAEMHRSDQNIYLCAYTPIPTTNDELRLKVPLGSRIASALGLVIFRKSYRFGLLCFLGIVCIIPFSGSAPFIIPRAQSIDITPSVAALLLTLNGIGSLLGRLGNGLVISWKLSAETVCSISAAVTGTSLFLMNADSFVCMSVVSFLLGLSSGVMYSVCIVLTRQYVGDLQFSVCFGIYSTCVGIGALLGGVAAGWVFDVTASYKAVFYVLGGIAFACAFLMCLLPVLKRIEPGIDVKSTEP
ncbi:monocarboxylate transporter 13-like [Acanthaster planci]|uniref:Monocarboxylate transporter 13-like n=1 Tax=Acanthaster planci TaxID=133434 RepID=A0A8B7YJK0_ACAPL|nr:monocarboxylate transporter 13-like [Acanthaster planci]